MNEARAEAERRHAAGELYDLSKSRLTTFVEGAEWQAQQCDSAVDPFADVPEPSEHFLADNLFPFFDTLADEFGLNSDEMTADLARVLRPSVLDEYRVWIVESWESAQSTDLERSDHA